MTQENNSVYYILKAIKLIVSIRVTNSLSDLDLPELFPYSENDLELAGKILSTKNLRRAAWHFLDYGASTALILQRRLGTSKRSTYRYMNDLNTFKVIVPAIRTRGVKGKRGPKTDIWMVPDATMDQVGEAQKLHYRLLSPKYRLAEKVAQSLLDDYLTPRQTAEITYREIIIHVRGLHTSFNSLDIADLAAQYLHEKGIKVWR